MPNEPYRPAPAHLEEDAALARLAAEGQRKIHDAALKQGQSTRSQEEIDRDVLIRAGIGAHFGSPRRRLAGAGVVAVAVIVLALIVLGTAGDAMGVDRATVETLIPTLVLVASLVFTVAMVLLGLQPLATPARVEAERAWVASLPYRLEGYFDVLGKSGHVATHLIFALEWAGPAPDPSLVQGVVGTLDPAAQLQNNSGPLEIRSDAMPAGFVSTLSRGGRYAQNNRQLVAYTHALVDRVLAPIHARHPLSRVRVTTGSAFFESDVDARRRTIGFLIRRW